MSSTANPVVLLHIATSINTKTKSCGTAVVTETGDTTTQAYMCKRVIGTSPFTQVIALTDWLRRARNRAGRVKTDFKVSSTEAMVKRSLDPKQRKRTYSSLYAELSAMESVGHTVRFASPSVVGSSNTALARTLADTAMAEHQTRRNSSK